MKKYIALAGLAALVVTACGSEQPAEVVDQAAAPGASEEVVVEETEAPEETPETDAAEAGTAALGDTVKVGDEYGWEVTVTEVVKNANDAIASANEFNEPPTGQYVMVTFEATYVGDSRSADVESDLSWEFIGSDGVVYESAYVVEPSDAEDWPSEARQGATIRAQDAFDVPKNAIKGGLVSVNEWVSGDYAEFPIS